MEIETEILEKLKGNGNEYVVKYYGYSKDDNYYYIYMEYIEGKSIEETLQGLKNKRFEETILKDLAVKISKAVQSVHQQGIIHRDIKGSNILYIKDKNQIKLIDFGLSKTIENNDSKHYSFIGTETHMAPEVKVQNGKACRKSDIWSIGCTLIEMAGGNLKNGTNIPDYLSNKFRNVIQQCLTETEARADIDQLLYFLNDDKPIHTRNNTYVSDNLEPIPENVTDLLLIAHTENQRLPSIPDSVTKLDIYDFDQISKVSIPNSVKTLTLKDFNQTWSFLSILGFDNGVIPCHISTLVLDTFNQIIPVGLIPDSVTNLELGSFNCSIIVGSLPNSIKTLVLERFNQNLETDQIPDGVTNLYLNSFNHPISSKSIPLSVKLLSMRSFTNSIGVDSILSVKSLCLGEFDLKQNGDNLPDSISELWCSFKFDYIIVKRHIPPSVTHLCLFGYNKPLQSNSIPKSVTSLTLGLNFNDIDTLSYLPSSIINLEFGTSLKNIDSSLITVNKNITSLKINLREYRKFNKKAE